jgi:hypothetical protein
MPYFTEGWMWFLSGLGVTLLMAAVAVVLVFAARTGEKARERGRRRPGTYT